MRDWLASLSTLIGDLLIALDPRLLQHPWQVEQRVNAYLMLLGLLILSLLLLSVPAVTRRWRRLVAPAVALVGSLVLPAIGVLAWDAHLLASSKLNFSADILDPSAVRQMLHASFLLWPLMLLAAAAGGAIYLALAATWRRSGLSPLSKLGFGLVSMLAIVLLASGIAKYLPPALERELTQISGQVPTREQSVQVLFGTDRRKAPTQVSGVTVWGFDNVRGRQLTLGAATVTIPRNHARGQIELPAAYSIFGVTFYREKSDPAKHFILGDLQLLTREAFLARISQHPGRERAMIFIHGFNTSFEAGLFRTAQLFHDLRFSGTPFYYSWPSRGGLEQYVSDRSSSEQAQPYLRRFLELIAQESGVRELHIIAHSMGNMPLLRVLREMRDELQRAPTRIREIVLAAPDVDRDIFEQLASAVSDVGNVTLYASSNDRAMMASRMIGVAQAGDVPRDGPVVVRRVETIDASAASTDVLALNHSGYAESPEILADVSELLRCGTRPPPRRSNRFDEFSTASGPFWRLKVTEPKVAIGRACQ